MSALLAHLSYAVLELSNVLGVITIKCFFGGGKKILNLISNRICLKQFKMYLCFSTVSGNVC